MPGLGERKYFWDDGAGCPHYGNLLNRCMLSRGGIYIPVEEYVRRFCRSEGFAQCEILQADGRMAQVLEEARASSNRRRHERYPDRISLMLAMMDVPENTDSLLDDSAFTVDLSEGGMCLASQRRLPVDSLISFRFGSEFRQSLQGVGQVRWCTSPDDSPFYHAGMMFTEHHVRQAVGRYLAA